MSTRCALLATSTILIHVNSRPLLECGERVQKFRASPAFDRVKSHGRALCAGQIITNPTGTQPAPRCDGLLRYELGEWAVHNKRLQEWQQRLRAALAGLGTPENVLRQAVGHRLPYDCFGFASC